MTILMLLGFHFLNNFQCSREERTSFQFGEMRSERAPLLSQKDDDLSSWGSSYDSVSQDDEDLEDGMAADSLEGKPLKDGEYNNNIRRLCAICFDAPRDCFFLPCGHCVACFACGTRYLLFSLIFIMLLLPYFSSHVIVKLFCDILKLDLLGHNLG